MKKVSFLLVMLMAFVFTNSQAATTAPKAKANIGKIVQKPQQKPAADAKKKPMAAKPVTAAAKPAASTKPAATQSATAQPTAATQSAPVAKTDPATKPEPKK